jgi:Fe-Mn family superoxide dismutase
MPHVLPALPYAKNALEPFISAQTLEIHHGKHHNAYVVKLNELIVNTEYEKLDLEAIILKSAKDSSKATVFNNAAQVWNHSFYWLCMKPQGGGKPTGALAQKIDEDFGNFDNFATTFRNAGANRFGSGWAWLVLSKEGKLKVTSTGNAELPMTEGETALLTMDVWEHAYYIDYQNRRPDYMATFLDKVVNWDFVAQNFAEASQKKAA